MRTVLISYDLNSIHKDYGDVISYIKSLVAWARPLKSQWLVKTDLSPINIINDLRAHGADGDDSLLVIDVTKSPSAWSNLSLPISNWIQNEL